MSYKEVKRMTRMTTDSPIGNYERACNLFYVEERETWVRDGDQKAGKPDTRLYDHIRSVIKNTGAEIPVNITDAELDEELYDLLFDGTGSLEGLIAHYYTAAAFFSELRAYLKCYEDSGMPRIDPDGRKTIDAAIIEYGKNAQMDMAVEEMAELTKAICKRKRTGATGPEAVAARENLLEEIADVFIMLVQLVRMFDGAEEIQHTVDEKMCRLKNRIERGRTSE